jgi:hypothetical protein
VLSNGDISADYVGLKFYRNLTEPMRIKGEIRPPLLIRDGHFFRLNTHVRRDSDFFKVFISDHLNEVLNPGEFSPYTGLWVRGEIRKRCHAVVNWYRDAAGLMNRDDFDRRAMELSTYFGEDYGHMGNLAKMISVSNVCFPPATNESVSDVNQEERP